ncbi:MAG: hypothetical protein V5A68_07025 [Candidatus Thermoplasmatota archaeon]
MMEKEAKEEIQRLRQQYSDLKDKMSMFKKMLKSDWYKQMNDNVEVERKTPEGKKVNYENYPA